MSDNELGTVRVNQCEVTYINHIVAGDGWETHVDMAKVFTIWHQPQAKFPGPVEDAAAIRAKFPIFDEGKFCGRLHMVIQPVKYIGIGKPMFLWS